MKRFWRIMELLDCLRDREWTTGELAERLAVSRRTIQRDLNELRQQPSYTALLEKSIVDRRYVW